ncbi:hypothetical protein BDV98DRAFT_569475 [Pterulicium gracile]|uniref:Uncharacterized protein n=1 Tax=Pterulicium gracile TaxID=1884261 RepID=A0A5C3QDW7_9AGAR|nr:hypothetical protein BDV98DRAFT_569475 [Pterula gracilis]
MPLTITSRSRFSLARGMDMGVAFDAADLHVTAMLAALLLLGCPGFPRFWGGSRALLFHPLGVRYRAVDNFSIGRIPSCPSGLSFFLDVFPFSRRVTSFSIHHHILSRLVGFLLPPCGL